jgi:hypothetical protein
VQKNVKLNCNILVLNKISKNLKRAANFRSSCLKCQSFYGEFLKCTQSVFVIFFSKSAMNFGGK